MRVQRTILRQLTVVVEKGTNLRVGQRFEVGSVDARRLNEVFVRTGKVSVGTQTIPWNQFLDETNNFDFGEIGLRVNV